MSFQTWFHGAPAAEGFSYILRWLFLQNDRIIMQVVQPERAGLSPRFTRGIGLPLSLGSDAYAHQGRSVMSTISDVYDVYDQRFVTL